MSLQQILGAPVELLQSAIDVADGNAQLVGLGVILPRRFVVGSLSPIWMSRWMSRCASSRLLLKLHNLLLHGDQLFRLGIVVLEAVAAHAAATLEKFLAGTQHCGAWSTTMSMAWHCWQPAWTFCLGVERPQPVLILPCALSTLSTCMPLPPWQGEQPIFLRVVDSQQFRVRVAGERADM